MSALIDLKRVTKLYGSVIGVNDISLELEKGAYGLLGPNGSGKTTLLNLITGQLSPTLGEVRTLGHRPENNAKMLRRIGVCPSTDLLLPNVSGLQWTSHLLELGGFSRRAARQRAEEVLASVGLTDAMHRSLSSYSKGMRQRAKLAQAFAHDPEFLLLDEPFNGLDPVGRHEMTTKLLEWTRDGGSLLLASHILHEVESIAGSFLLICGGRLLASGSAVEVRSLLANIPHEIRICCDRPKVLAQGLMETDLIEGLRSEKGGAELVVATRTPVRVYEELPGLIDRHDLAVSEIRSPDESLQALFDSLLRIHRGESP